MKNWERVKINSFMKAREEIIKPEEANEGGLKRLNKIDFSGKIHITEKPTKTNMILVKPWDLVISGINVEKGAISVYQGDKEILATIHYSSYEVDRNKIDLDYFMWFLKSKLFKEIVNSQIRGGIKTELKPKKFLPLEIPLPPKEEQIKIRDKIGNDNSKIEKFGNLQTSSLSLIQKLRQKILREAVQGKLTEQNPDDEPASELLKKIKKEKDRLIKEGKIKKQKPLPEITEDEIPYELPNNWCWTRLGEIANIKRGASPRPINSFITESQNGVNWIKIGDSLKGSKYIISTNQKITEEGAKRSVFVNKGDLVMSNSMSFGRPYILGIDGCIHDGWLAISFNESFMNKNFLYYTLLSIQDYYEAKAVGTGVRNLNIDRVLNAQIPLPPLPEQKRIVEKVDKFMALCDELEKRVKENQQNSEKLMQAVLGEVF